MRNILEIVADFLNTDFARKDCDDPIVCDLIAEMDEHFGSNPAVAPDIECDLLVAMKAMFKECAMIHKYGGDCYNGKQAAAAIKAGRDAMAKAEAV